MSNPDSPLCTCGWLEREADEPNAPVRFDAELNEYNIICKNEGSLRIYHCPFCGGRAPASKRALMFAHIDQAERERLTQLTYSLRCVRDVLKALGQPDHDLYSSAETPEKDGLPPKVQVYRRLMYHRLSSVADLWVLVHPGDSVSITFQGKYVGPPDTNQQSSPSCLLTNSESPPVCSLTHSAEADPPRGRRRRIWLGGLMVLLLLGVLLCTSPIWAENHRTQSLVIVIVAAGSMTITLLDMFWWKRRADGPQEPPEQ